MPKKIDQNRHRPPALRPKPGPEASRAPSLVTTPTPTHDVVTSRRSGLRNALLSAGAVAATAVGVNLSRNSQPEAPHPAPIEAREKLNQLKVGNFTFVFEGFEAQDQEDVKALIQKTYPAINRYLPLDKTPTRTIPVKKMRGRGPMSQYDANSNALEIGDMINPGLFVHEMVHAYHGLNMLDGINSMEEGIATAVGLMVSEELGLEYMQIQAFSLGETLQKGGLGLDMGASYIGYGPLIDIRYMVTGEFWKKLETEKSGFLRDFHEAYYPYFNEGNVEDPELPMTLIRRFIEPHFPDFMQRSGANPALRQNARLNDRPIIVSFYVDYKGGKTVAPIKAAMAGLVVKDSRNGGLERPLAGKEVEYQVINRTTGGMGAPRIVVTDGSGVIRIVFEDSEKKLPIVKDPVTNPGDKIEIRLRTADGSVGDKLEFTR